MEGKENVEDTEMVQVEAKTWTTVFGNHEGIFIALPNNLPIPPNDPN